MPLWAAFQLWSEMMSKPDVPPLIGGASSLLGDLTKQLIDPL